MGVHGDRKRRRQIDLLELLSSQRDKKEINKKTGQKKLRGFCEVSERTGVDLERPHELQFWVIAPAFLVCVLTCKLISPVYWHQLEQTQVQKQKQLRQWHVAVRHLFKVSKHVGNLLWGETWLKAVKSFFSRIFRTLRCCVEIPSSRASFRG